ncbi:MAG TPA: hypothetical protein VK943_07995 [Arenibaculum sp.]|nr:hypothetical protein [Arenibaculum sp.]
MELFHKSRKQHIMQVDDARPADHDLPSMACRAWPAHHPDRTENGMIVSIGATVKFQFE